MSIPPVLTRRSVALGFVLLLPAGVEAHPGQGSMGEQSRASIAISVSVMPRFSLGQGPRAPTPLKSGETAGRDAFQIFSNSADLRIRLVGPSRASGPQEARLFLIAAD
jgi:hypothetical protein